MLNIEDVYRSMFNMGSLFFDGLLDPYDIMLEIENNLDD